MWNHQITQFVFCSLYVYMYFILIRMTEMLCERNPTIFISLLDSHAFYPHSLPLPHWWVRKAWKERKRVCPIFPPPFLCYHFLCKWLTNTESKKGHDRVPQYFYFSECDCFLSLFKASSGLYGKHGWTTYSVVDITHLPYTCFESHWTPTHHVSIGILCSWGHHKSCTWVRWQEKVDRHIACIASAHAHAPIGLCLWNISLMIKLFKISRWQQQTLNQAPGSFWT